MKYKGKAHKVGDHIDTDAIIPARFLVTAEAEKLGPNCMAGLEPGWAARVREGDILVAGRNFGCGSSREHAPLAILGAGIKAVVGESFARIFYRNAFNTGLPLLEIAKEVENVDDGDELEIDTDAGYIRNLTKNTEIKFRPIPPSMNRILESGGLVGYTKKRLQEKAGH